MLLEKKCQFCAVQFPLTSADFDVVLTTRATLRHSLSSVQVTSRRLCDKIDRLAFRYFFAYSRAHFRLGNGGESPLSESIASGLFNHDTPTSVKKIGTRYTETRIPADNKEKNGTQGLMQTLREICRYRARHTG